MRLHIRAARISRGDWSLAAEGTFRDGVHLVSGDVGSGKSTLALMMAGLLPPEHGNIEQEGISLRMISLQFPEYQITGSTVAEECESWGLDWKEILHEVNLMGKCNVAPLTLSRGELKRLHLACILAKKYDLLLLDEPFSSLDAREKERICEKISRRTGEITILFTHEQATFPRIDQIWEIEQGILKDRGVVPDALVRWGHAPALIKKLIANGRCLKNISPADLMEAGCTM
ncbi:MAG: ATP-binding cassette domain-containing protein [Methanomicrobiales archaeon]